MKSRWPLTSWVLGTLGLLAWAGAVLAYEQQVKFRSLASSDLFAAGTATVLQYFDLLLQDTFAALGLSIVGTLFIGFAAIVAQIRDTYRD